MSNFEVCWEGIAKNPTLVRKKPKNSNPMKENLRSDFLKVVLHVSLFSFQIWLTVWAAICFSASLGAALTLFIGGGRVKARPLISLALCYCFVSAGWAIRLVTGRSSTSCQSFNGEIAEDGLANANCAFVFLMIYYFSMAANAW